MPSSTIIGTGSLLPDVIVPNSHFESHEFYGRDGVRMDKTSREIIDKLESITGIRERTGLSQAKFAALLGVSVRTLQEWEQGRRAPSGAARTLLLVAA